MGVVESHSRVCRARQQVWQLHTPPLGLTCVCGWQLAGILQCGWATWEDVEAHLYLVSVAVTPAPCIPPAHPFSQTPL